MIIVSPIIAVSDSTDISLEVETGISPVCNGNGICEPERGETEDNCSADCGCNNNGICESVRGENSSNCPNDCPAPAPPAEGGGVLILDTTPPLIYDLFISEITLNSATISWKIDEQALCQLFWGKTQEYEGGAITEDAFSRGEHSTKIIHLLPETTYHFKISCKDTNRNEAETKDQKFTTLTPPDITPPANISNFEAIPSDKKITLRWQNPPDPDFKEVKILRSTEFYPLSPWEGTLVYIGSETSFEDINLTNGVTYYYTAFSYDRAGNYSSGAVVAATPQAPPIPPVKPPVKPPIVPPPPEVEKLTLKDFDFWQKEKKLPLIEERNIKLKEEEPLTVSIDYEKVPEVLKTIMVTLEKDNKYFSFLLRINREKTKYLATLVPPEPGIYPLSLYVLDFKNQTLKTIIGKLIVEKTITEVLPKVPWYKNFKIWLAILIAAIGIAIITYLLRKKARTNLSTGGLDRPF